MQPTHARILLAKTTRDLPRSTLPSRVYYERLVDDTLSAIMNDLYAALGEPVTDPEEGKTALQAHQPIHAHPCPRHSASLCTRDSL